MAEGYNYNAIAEHPIIPEFEDTLKWKWNGALLDLSELPFEEYTKTVFQTSGSGGGGGDQTGGTKVITNSVTLSYDNTGDTYEVIASVQYPTESELTVTVNVEGESEPVNIVIPAGAMRGRKAMSRPSTDPQPVLEDPSISPVKDENYTYVVVVPEVIKDKFKAYYGVVLQSKLNTVDSAKLMTMSADMIDSTGMTLKYTIPARDLQNVTDEQLLNDYRYALVVAIPQSVYDANEFTFLEHTFQSPSEFVFSKNLAIETSPYTVLVRTSDGMQYVSRYMNTIEYEFDMKYTG